MTMGYRLRGKQSLAEDLQGVMIEQADKALLLLQERYDTDAAAAVHGVRKHLRRMRALLRLIRPALGKEAWAQANSALRDLGRQLSPARDVTVLIQTLDRLMGSEPEPSVREALASTPTLPPRSEVEAVLHQVRVEAAAWPLSGPRWSLIGGGLAATYRAGRKAADRAQKGHSAEDWHTWRKRAKELRHHMEILAPLKPARIEHLAGELHALADLLGEEHDLSLLRDALVHLPGPEPEVLLVRIDERRAAAQQDASQLGRRLFAEKPARFAARFQRWWRAWRTTS